MKEKLEEIKQNISTPINNTKKDSEKSSSEVAINYCSINIGGMSDRSRITLDKYCHDKGVDVLAIQESLTVDEQDEH